MEINEFWERINSLIKQEKTTQRALSKECGFTERRIETLVSTERHPDAIEAFFMAKALKTTVEYLLTGQPPEGIPLGTLEIARKIASLPTHDREEIMLLVKHKLERYPEDKKKALFTAERPPAYEVKTRSKSIDISKYAYDEIPMDSVKFMGWNMTILPIVGKTAAGSPIEINNYTSEGMPFPRQLLKGKEEDYFIVKIEGTSMTEAGIHTGDHVIIRKAEEPVNGKIMLIRYENSSTLKRIKVK